MKRLMFTIRFGISFSAALLAVTLAGCEASKGNGGAYGVGTGDKLVLDQPENIPGPNHTGPKQIDLHVDLSSTSDSIYVGPQSKVYVVHPVDSRKQYLVIEGISGDK